MCGIVAIVGREESRGVDAALRAMVHRGPDASGTWKSRVGTLETALGHVRLSILDLTSAANQPFSISNGLVTLAFNGEIYNHRALRRQLEAEGVRFATHSDTEVLAWAYWIYGRSCLQMLRGMFAFVLIDKRNRRLLAARDKFGIKPLYCCKGAEHGEFAFASEARAMEALLGRKFSPDSASYAEFLLNGFLYEPKTGLEHLNKVPPGTFVEIDLESGQALQGSFEAPECGAEMDLAEMVESELSLEVAADVPVGAFFSGGIDSSVVAAFSPKSIGALFVDYSDCEDHPDLVLAKDIARLLNLDFKRTHHVVGTKSVDEILDEFRAVAAGTEDPISDYTFYATKIISRVARAAGYKVMLSGMGGDELFAGYPRHALVRHLGIGKMLGTVTRAVAPLVRATERWGRRIDRLQSFISADGFLEGYTNLVGYFSYDEVSRLLGSRSGVESYENTVGELLAACEHRSPLKKALWLDRFGYLSHNLTVTDKASMSEGLEVRVPLITERLARMGMSLRDAQLIRGIEGKLPLKRLLEQKLPKKLIYRRKRAFNPPLRSPIQRIGPKLLGSLLLKGPLRDVLDTKFVEQWINQHFQGQADHTYRLWQLLYFSMWLEIHDSKG